MEQLKKIGIAKVAALVVLFIIPPSGWARVRAYRPTSRAPNTELTRAQRFQNKNVGKVKAGKVLRALMPKGNRFSFRARKRYTPSVVRTAGTLKRRQTRFLWYKRGRRSKRVARTKAQHRRQRRSMLPRRARPLKPMVGARFDGRTFQGRMALYREARISGRQVRGLERRHSGWVARYGLTQANKMLQAKVGKYMEAMSRLRERQRKNSARIDHKLARQSGQVSPRRRRLVGRMLRRIRSHEGPRLRIFTRGRRGGLRSLWRVSLRSQRRPQHARSMKPRPGGAPKRGAGASQHWGYQPLLAP